MLRIAPGVDMAGVQPEMTPVMIAATHAFGRLAKDATITSARDGNHSPGSLHYVGLALDWRTSVAGITQDQAEGIASLMREALGKQYDIVVESNHIHSEFQPKVGKL